MKHDQCAIVRRLTQVDSKEKRYKDCIFRNQHSSKSSSKFTLNPVPGIGTWVLAIAVLVTCVFIPKAWSQMMGGHMGQMMGGQMGPMMGGGHMRAMQALMSWMRGGDIKVLPSEPKPKFSGELRASGKLLYGEHCAICHGENGDGNGSRAGDLSPRPRDFTKGLYEFRSTPSGALPTDEDIWKVISGGLHGTAMLPWISLSESQRWALVAYVESFSPKFESEARAASLAIPAPPAETPELIARGQKLFNDSGCVECHGSGGHGDGPATPSLKDSSGLPIRPLDFGSGIFRRGSSMDDIFLTLRTGLNGTPMPSYADSLTPDETWAVAAYVRSLIGSPADEAAVAAARQQERMGMAIDMPGMAGMPMGGMMQR